MRRFNWPLWIGFIVTLFAFVSYLPLFVRFAATRDLPWATYLIFAVGLLLVGLGFRRAQPKVAASIVTILSVAVTGFFVFGANFGTHMPASPTAPAIGAKAPDFTLPDTNRKPVALAQLLAAPGAKGVILIFYRGYW